ncbi:MAG: TlpA family protein disulfide reductase, partial [Chryseobacterium sp.]
PYPYVFIDKINNNSFYNSEVFFINSKTKNIVVGKKDLPENFEVINNEIHITNEVSKFQNYFAKLNGEKQDFQKVYRAKYDQFEDKEKIPQEFWDDYMASEKTFSVKEDSLLLGFVKVNPNSFVALWKLVEKFDRNGYSESYNETYNHLSSEIKSKQTAETLRLAIKEASLFQVGKKFPHSKIKNVSNPNVEFSIPKAKYTLVDFWFSSCKPCLEQMPNYVELYAQYRAKGFEIVGVSTDQTQYKNNLISTIQKFKIPWNNYWDENGKQSSDWTITSFPTNYLLDEEGKILVKNISEKELTILLKEKLN